MEDILASIRRILSEEETPPAGETAPAAAPDTDVLVLDEFMLTPAEPAGAPAEPGPVESRTAEPPAFESPAFESAAVDPPGAEPAPLASLPADRSAADAAAEAPLGVAPAAEATGGLVAPEAAAAAAASVAGLLRTLASDRALQVRTGGPTIEDIVRQTLRPLLKEWLDAHLPELVERLVRAEIERVVNRAVP